jgi:hypothetical protein
MAYLQYREITIDHLEVPNTDQTDFPVLVSGTYSYLATIANGGKVSNSNGYDIAFYADSDLTDQLSHETEKYNATTGEVIYWVKVPTVAHATDTTIYIAYGNTAISTSQENITDVWSNSFREVYHFPDGTTLTANDSTSLNNDAGTITSVTAVAGKIDGGGSYGTGSIITGFPSILSTANTTRTITAWVKRDNSTRGGIVGTRHNTAGKGFVFTTNFGGVAGALTYFNTGGGLVDGTAAGMPLDDWGYAAATWGSGSGEVFMNGASVTTNTGGNDTAPNGNGHIGCENHTGTQPLNGDLDELRIATVKRTSDWLTTEYNNQSSPSDFYSIGAEIEVPVVSTNFMFWFSM